MSAVFNHERVLLAYADPSVQRPHHIQRKPQPSDRERQIVIAAERKLLTLRVIVDNSDFSELAEARIYSALNTVQGALEMIRSRLGLAQSRKCT